MEATPLCQNKRAHVREVKRRRRAVRASRAESRLQMLEAPALFAKARMSAKAPMLSKGAAMRCRGELRVRMLCVRSAATRQRRLVNPYDPAVRAMSVRRGQQT